MNITRVDRVWQYIQHRQDNELINLHDVFSGLDPKTPPPTDSLKIPMTGPFPVEKFKEVIIYTLRLLNYTDINNDHQCKYRLTVRTWKKLFDLFNTYGSDCEDRKEQFKLEALLVIVKADRTESFNYREEKYQNYTEQKYYDLRLSNYIHRLTWPQLSFESVRHACNPLFAELKTFLARPAIVKALVSAINHVFGPEKVDELWVRQCVDKMEIYWGNLYGFTGLALRDGIYAFDGLFAPTSQRKATLYTLCVHESAHHLARICHEDFNFSSPFSAFDIKACPRGDPEMPEKSLELGRYAELLLFDGIQPSFMDSNMLASIKFLARAESEVNYPVIPRSMHQEFELNARKQPSISFGAEYIYWHEPDIVELLNTTYH